MSTAINRRNAAALAAIGTSVFAALAAPSGAGASSLYACVQKNGTARLFASKPRCRHREKLLAWNIEGPQGPRGRTGATGKTGHSGANGSNGSNGSNGAAAGFSASAPAFVALTGGGEPWIVGRQLPAGSFIVVAKLAVRAASTSKGAGYDVACFLLDGSPALDTSEVIGPLTETRPGAFGATSNMTLEGAVSWGAASQVNVQCRNSSGAEVAVEVGYAQLVAVQTAMNS